MTAAAMRAVWIISETNPTPNKRFLSVLRFDSIKVSNTRHLLRGSCLSNSPFSPPAARGAPLQNDDKWVGSCPVASSRHPHSRARSHPGPGERYGEVRAAPRPARHVDPSPMRLSDPLADVQAEPGARASARAGACGVGAPEAVEDVGQIARGNADPG